MRLFRISVLMMLTGVVMLPHPCSAQETNKSLLKKVTGVFSSGKPKIPGNMRFSEYSGFDAFEWETSIGSLADTSYKLPVYRGWPSRPYLVIGDVRHKDLRKQWEEGELRDAVKAGVAVGGEAIIIRHGSEAGVQALTGTSENRGIYSQAQTTALVVRWQTDAEVKARQQRDLGLFERLKSKDPSVASLLDPSEQAGSLAIRFLLRSGVKDDAPEFFPRLQNVIKRIQSTNDSLSGEWLFKVVLKTGGLTTQSERNFMGIATVRVDGESFAVVSVQGETEANFSGQLTGGRLTGQVGVAGFSAKSDGVAVARKISLSFQSVTQNGTVQGTFVLQR